MSSGRAMHFTATMRTALGCHSHYSFKFSVNKADEHEPALWVLKLSSKSPVKNAKYSTVQQVRLYD